MHAILALVISVGGAVLASKLWIAPPAGPNPRDSAAWIERGLRAEQAGDLLQAGRALLEAARWDRQFLPAWTLANYCFRRSNDAEFWKWAARAARMAYDDPRPLLVLGLQMTDDAASIAEKLPGRRVERSLLDLLIAESQWDAASTVARKLLDHAEADDAQRLAAWSGRLIALGRRQEALAVWNGLTGKGFNISETGFDWKREACSGTESERSSAEFHWSLSGRQSEVCELLSRWLALDPGSRYRLRFEYRLEGPSSGVKWAAGGATSEELAPGKGWRSAEWVFTGNPLDRLVLFYRRNPGAVRLEGELKLRLLAVERI